MFDFDSQREFAQSPKVVATRRAKQSVESRQRDIYDSHRHRTFALAYYMTGNEIEAETILTASFVRAFQAKKEPEAQEIDAALLQELREREHLQQDAPAVAGAASSEPTSGDLSGRNVKRTDLEEAIRELPATERLLFLLRDVEGYTSAVIAKLMGMQEAEVNRNLLKARLHLRRILAEAVQGDEEKAA